MLPSHLSSALSASLLLLTSAGLGVACSSKVVEETDVCTTYAKRIHAYNERCNPSSTAPDVWAELERRDALLCNRMLSLPDTGLSAGFLDKCLAVVASAPCGAIVTAPECRLPPGKVANGGACSDDTQCASLRCKAPSGTCGTCQATVAVGGDCSSGTCISGAACVADVCVQITQSPLGGACDAVAKPCGAEAFCDPGTKTCQARPGEGAACPEAVCASGLRCESGKCVTIPKLPAGASCSLPKSPCADGLLCATGNVCTAIRWVDPGGDCSVLGARCKRGSCIGSTKTCPTILADGAACDASGSAICDEGARCTAGKCTLQFDNFCK